MKQYLIGKSKEEVLSYLIDTKVEYRIVSEDGKNSDDFKPERANLAFNQYLLTEIYGG